MAPLPIDLTSLITTHFPPLLHYPVKFCLSTTVFVYIASLITSNVSQVDRLWTFLPTIYTAYFALLPLWPRGLQYDQGLIGWVAPHVPSYVTGQEVEEFDKRALMVLGLVTTWMCRLSYNTWRRGLFNLKDEDYRWAVLRTQLHPILFQITNLTFISFIQNIILLLLGLPTYFIITSPSLSIPGSSFPQPTDLAIAISALTLLALEFTSDNQQFAYHAWKHAIHARNNRDTDAKEYNQYDEAEQWVGARLDWTEADAKLGFLRRGLWAWARHPNFTCEQSFWWVITLTPLLSLPSSLRDALSIKELAIYLSPAIVLSTLFFSSTAYTEAITAKKYPQYQEYQEEVPMFGPFGISGFRTGPLRWVFRRLGGGKDGKKVE